MNDGSRLEVEKQNVPQGRLNGQSDLSPDERYLRNASRLGQLRAEQDYQTLTDPYVRGYRAEIQDEAYKLYFSMEAHGDQFARWNSGEEAVADYLDQFDTTRFQILDEMSGATTKGTRELIVAAAKDRIKKSGISSEYAHGIRAILRAYHSLMTDEQIFSEELSDEDMLLVQNRAALYHNRYNQNRSRMAVSSEIASKEVD